MEYRPLSDGMERIELDPGLEEQLDSIARNVHDAWARERLLQGWRYGPSLDREAKTHPSLVPYEELSEQERQLDLSTARQVLKSLLSLGYRIEKGPTP